MFSREAAEPDSACVEALLNLKRASSDTGKKKLAVDGHKLTLFQVFPPVFSLHC